MLTRTNMADPLNCCNELFSDFKFCDLQDAEPPNRKGVYAIRIKKRGKDIKEIIAQSKQLINKVGWQLVSDFIFSRIERLERIDKCPIIYIGSAGTYSNSKNTLLKRYKEFSGRHTAMYPIWALIYFDWKLEFGWKEEKNAKKAEDKIKKLYKNQHGDKLPALVQR